MNDTLFLFVALAFLGAMLFFSSRKRKKAAETLQNQVVKGAYVMLTSGIYGKITAVLDNRVELEVASGTKMLVAMGAVRSIEEPPKNSKRSAQVATKSKPKPKTAVKTTAKKK
jgi:preprotein translocase subunit YajC